MNQLRILPIMDFGLRIIQELRIADCGLQIKKHNKDFQSAIRNWNSRGGMMEGARTQEWW